MPEYNQPRKTWRYSNEFKAKAVQLSLLDGVKVKEVAAVWFAKPATDFSVYTMQFRRQTQ